MLAGYTQRAHELKTLPSFKTTALTAASLDAAPSPASTAKICVTVTNLAAAKAAREAGADLIYMTVDSLVAEGISPQDVQNLGIIPILDEICRKADHDHLDAWAQAGGTVAVGNISEPSLAHLVGTTAEIRSCLPVHNLACIRAMEEHGASTIWFSPNSHLPRSSASPRMQKPLAASLSWESRVL